MCIKNFASYRCGCTLFRNLTLCDRNDGSCERSWAAPDPANWSIRNSAFLCPGCFRRSQPERPNVHQPRLSAEQVSAREAMLEDARSQIRDLELEKQQRKLDARIRELEFELALAERQTQVRVMEHVEEMEAAERRMQFLQAGVELRALDREVGEEEEHLSQFRAQQSSARRAQELEREREVSDAESHIRALEHQEKMAGLNEQRRFLQAGVELRALDREVEEEEGHLSQFRAQQSSARRAQELEREREVSDAESHVRALEHQEKMAGLNEQRRYLQAGLESRALQEEIDLEEGEASRSRSSRSRGP